MWVDKIHMRVMVHVDKQSGQHVSLSQNDSVASNIGRNEIVSLFMQITQLYICMNQKEIYTFIALVEPHLYREHRRQHFGSVAK
jgi:hypothetical protein